MTRRSRRTIFLSTLLAGLLPIGSPASAFHDAGVGACNGCHVMHDSEDGQPVPPGDSGQWLLRAETPSDLCLSCHATGLGAVFGPDPLSPPPEVGAGNFVFLLEDNLNDGPDGMTNPISGDAAGHNVNAPSHGVSADATYATSPGGSYPSRNLGCTSCHDPHGNGHFRMLRTAGSADPWGATFSHAAPAAEGLDVTTSAAESDASHTAYHSGVSRWCGNCHPDYLRRHDHGVSAFAHGTDRAMGMHASQHYDAYNGTDDPAGGNHATAYLAAVPFEDASITTSSTQGPLASSRLNCLSCHRAHASSGPHAGRWDFNIELLGEDGAISGSYPIPNPYPGPTQQSLCHKCHSPIPD